AAALLVAAAWLIAPIGCRAGDVREKPGAGMVGGDDRAAEWTIPARDYQSTRYSPLAQVTAANVGQLTLAWSYSTGSLRGHEGAPLVVGSTLYLVTPFPNELVALDLARHGALRWKYRPPVLRAAGGAACCDLVNRGASYADGTIYFATLDNQVVAVDAEHGRERWRTRVGDINRGESITMAPLVVRGKVLVGNSGGEYGVRGWLTALDARTGTIAWRAYTAGPDEDVRIGARFKPFYPLDRKPNLGATTWPGQAWRNGGGTVWGWISYDPALNLIYYGTGNPGPWNHELRRGDNKWATSLMARDPDTGEAVWAYQFTPHDLWDHDGVNEAVLVDLTVDGKARKVALLPERNGYLYVMDRASGEVLSATPFVHVNSTMGVDLKSGRPIVNAAKTPRAGTVVRDVCPASPGAKDWQPSAWSPRTKLLYIPHQNLCMDFGTVEANYIAGTPYVGAEVTMKPGPGGNRGFLTAWDPVARRPAWQLRENFPVWSGALVTAGDVVFYGTMDRHFRAVDARTGARLWDFTTASGIIGQPITFQGPDGKQYVAIFDGPGGWAGAVVAGDLNPGDSLAAAGFVGAMGDLPKYTEKGGTLNVFALP
ncbi:MAG TPA: PQQ-dependent dehydrogenase, methanol/ethanol family, partial [Gemmatimonadaceae bacterium]